MIINNNILGNKGIIVIYVGVNSNVFKINNIFIINMNMKQ